MKALSLCDRVARFGIKRTLFLPLPDRPIADSGDVNTEVGKATEKNDKETKEKCFRVVLGRYSLDFYKRGTQLYYHRLRTPLYRMEERHKKILQRNRINLVRGLDPSNLYDGLIEKGVFTHDMIDEIKVI